MSWEASVMQCPNEVSAKQWQEKAVSSSCQMKPVPISGKGSMCEAVPREGSAKQCQEQPAAFDPRARPGRVYGPGEPSRVQSRRRYSNSYAVESLNYARSGGTATSPAAVPRPEQGIKEAVRAAGVGGTVPPTIR